MSISSNYQGVAAVDYISKALLGAPSIEAGRIREFTNIKHKLNVRRLDVANFDLSAYTPEFQAATGFTYSEKVLDPFDFSVFLQEDKKILEATFEAERMRPGSQNSDITLSDWIAERMSLKVRNKVEKAIWRAEQSTSADLMTAIDGYETLLKASGDSVKITGGTITKTNVLAEMEKVYEELHALEVEHEEYLFYMNPKTASVYRMKIGTDSPVSAYSERQPLFYQGHEFHVTHGISDGVIIAAKPDLLFFGTDLVSDMNSVAVIDMMPNTGDNYVRFRLDAKADVAISFPEEVVIRY